jgi:hypothetical protein
MHTKNMALKARIGSNGQMTLPLQGRCMDPLLMAGDQVKIIPATHFSTGYLYLFELSDGSLAVHRLIDKTDTCVTMKGDRSRGFETVPFQNIIGEVSAVNLSGSENWRDIRNDKLTRIIAAHVSKKLAKDKRLKNENALIRRINRVRSNFLIFFSDLTRKRWSHP